MTNEKEVRNFLNRKIPCLDHCGQCGVCCQAFGYKGPVIHEDEKASVIQSLENMGLAGIAQYVKENGEIPAHEGKLVARACKLLDEDNNCLLHDTAKPKECVESPNFIIIRENNIVLQADIYPGKCRECMSEIDLERAVDSLKDEFEEAFRKPLQLRINYPIENRCKRYYD